MQRIIALVLVIVTVILSVSSCFLFKKNDDNDNTSPPAVEGAVYSAGSTLGFLVNEDTIYTSPLLNALAKKTSIVKADEEGEPLKNEIVIGVSNRSVSREAYKKLAEMRLNDSQIDDPDNYVKWLIYTDGNSVAIAYDEQVDYIGLRSAIDYCINNLVVDTLVLKPGIIRMEVTDIYEFYLAEDKALADAKWQYIASTVENGEEIVAAMKSLYTIYSDEMVDWMANLYEPDICECFTEECRGGATCGTGAFYYSNSARNTLGYLPDVESTLQMLTILEGVGMTDDYTKALDPEMLDKIGKFVIALQQSDGYFYHPQWGTGISVSRRGRDLMWAESILRKLGLSPIYDTPNGMKGTGLSSEVSLTSYLKNGSAVSVASSIVAAADSVDTALQDEESFRKYLDDLDIKNNSYSAGNTLAAYFSTIRSRNYQLQNEGADYDLVDILFEHLDSTQNPETGTWYYLTPDDPDYSEYYAVNGVMKISTIYESANRPFPNADKALSAAIKAITSDEELSACVDIYNTWFAISNIYSIMNATGGEEGRAIVKATRSEIRQNVASLVEATKNKIAIFQKNDGSFSYNPKYSAHEAQGCLAAMPYTEEGDVNATKICTSGTVQLIWTCLGVSNPVSIYSNAHMYRFNSIVSKLGHALKEEQDIYLEIDNGDNYGTGKYKDNALTFEGGTKVTNLVSDGIFGTDKPDLYLFDNYNYAINASIVETDDYTNILSLKKSMLADPFLYIYPQSTDATSYVFEADICVIRGITKMDDGQFFQIYFMNGESYWWSGSQVLYNADAYEGVERYNVDKAKNTFINQKTWYNYRVEIQDVSKTGSEVRLYINNVLVQKTLSTASASTLSRMQVRFRLNSTTSQILMDNVYFSAVKDLPTDDTVIIPEVNIKEYAGSDDIDPTNRGTGAYKNSSVQYTDTNATLLGLDGKIGTSGLVYDPNDTSGMGYLKIVGIKGDAALDCGKTTGSGDAWLYVPKTEQREGTAYVFETDFALMSGSEWRPNDNNLFSFYMSKDSSNSIFWGAQWHITIVDGEYFLYIPTKNADGETYEGKIDISKWYNFRIEIEGTAVGSLVKHYLNGELIHTAVMTSATSEISHMLLRFNLNTTGRMFMDNTYFSKVGEAEITPPDPAETVKDTANILSTATGADGIVVLMHDDASSTMYIMDEVFRELGLCGNIAMYPGGAILTDGALDASKVASWQKYLDSGRWQISSHSMTHTFPGLTDDEGLITQEVINSQLILREAFPSQRVLTYAYPGYWSEKAEYGDDRFSAVMREMVDSYYIAGRDSYGNKNISLTATDTDWKFAPSYQFDDSNVQTILNAITSTQNGEMAVLFTHMIVANNATIGSNQMYEENLRTICEAVAKLQDEGKVWVAFYEDAVLYVRESQAATVSATTGTNSITVTLTHSLDNSIYNYPLTVRVVTPDGWQAVKITQGERVSYATVKTVAGKTCIDASVVPNAENAVITPISVSEIPADSVDNSLSANRGSGALANNDSTLDFSDTTAGELKDSGIIGADSAVNIDGVAMGVIVGNEGGDNALKVGNAWGTTGNAYINSMTGAGKHYVFETDLMLYNCGTNRSDNYVFRIYGSKTANETSAYWGIQAAITKVDDKVYFVASVKDGSGNTATYELTEQKWYNIRIEIEDVTAGGNVKFYVNGELIHTGTTTNTATSLGSMVIWMPQTAGSIAYFDNTYFGAIDAETAAS